MKKEYKTEFDSVSGCGCNSGTGKHSVKRKKTGKDLRVIFLAAGFAVLVGCGAKNVSGPMGKTSDVSVSAMRTDGASYKNGFGTAGSDRAEAPEVMMDAEGAEEPVRMNDGGNGMDTPDQDVTKRIRTVDLTVSLEDDSKLNETADRIVEITKQYHGSVTDRSMSYSKYNAGGSITVKIPKDEVDGFLAGVRDQGMNVSRIDDRTEDVTQHYVDVEARLKAKQTEVDRLQSYLEKAEDTETLLKVEEQLTRAISDLESYKAQMNSLNSRIDATTVQIALECSKIIHEETTGEMAERIMKNTFRDTLETFLEGAKMFLGAIATLIWLIPIGMILITAVYRTIRWNRDKGKKEKTAPFARAKQEGKTQDPDSGQGKPQVLEKGQEKPQAPDNGQGKPQDPDKERAKPQAPEEDQA
ncbi:DUF4349 domain-containing protein [[Clostridium] aminophilum]|uniref:DUF4349 domain-containing protein n=1 Tax=[Clostridium] aminophilum TaxID=1526 RepID=A0A1I6IHV3_9FIRM|nr:DUF4349 domain-containing protein [[Clostridium] aminophilum]SFR66278.1 protein of unknown function [[Clostridium] aminophilum]